MASIGGNLHKQNSQMSATWENLDETIEHVDDANELTAERLALNVGPDY